MQKTTHHCECIPLFVLLERIYTGVIDCIDKEHWFIIHGVQCSYNGHVFVRESDNAEFTLEISSFDIRELDQPVFVIDIDGEEDSHDED